jgi:hypothetical protein
MFVEVICRVTGAACVGSYVDSEMDRESLLHIRKGLLVFESCVVYVKAADELVGKQE